MLIRAVYNGDSAFKFTGVLGGKNVSVVRLRNEFNFDYLKKGNRYSLECSDDYYIKRRALFVTLYEIRG